MTEDKEKFDLIDEMTKSVEKKLSEIKSIVPVILTVVTALIAFFFTQKIPIANREYFGRLSCACFRFFDFCVLSEDRLQEKVYI